MFENFLEKLFQNCASFFPSKLSLLLQNHPQLLTSLPLQLLTSLPPQLLQSNNSSLNTSTRFSQVVHSYLSSLPPSFSNFFLSLFPQFQKSTSLSSFSLFDCLSHN